MKTCYKAMILNASEELSEGTQDANGDMVTRRSTVVATYENFLQEKTTGNVRIMVSNFLNVTKKCSTSLPLSTVVAMHMGRLCWADKHNPEAFSILSCYHLAMRPRSLSCAAQSDTAMDGRDSLRLHLRSTEGDGLSQTDIDKGTKMVFYAPESIDVAAKQISIFCMLLAFVFGKDSECVRAFNSWPEHITQFEMDYRQAQSANSMFATRLVCFLD